MGRPSATATHFCGPRVSPAFEAPTDGIRATEKHKVRNRLLELFQTAVELSPGQKGPWNNYGK